MKISQETLDEIARVAREWPDGIHTCAELQTLEPGRRPCTCGRCKADHVIVYDQNGHPLFTGTIADTSPPWFAWNRVIPDGEIDLPPCFKLERVPADTRMHGGRVYRESEA